MSVGVHSDGIAPARYSPDEVAALVGRFRPTDEQSRVISAGLDPAVVIAGAGSGKTETMAARVVWLVANGLVTPDRVLGLTFTRKAAGELQQRVRSRLQALYRALGSSYEAAGDPTVLTYAAYAGRIVDEHAILLGAERDARLLTEAARWQVANSVVRRYDGSFTVEPGVISTVTERAMDLAAQIADHLIEPADIEALSQRYLEDLDTLPLKPRSRNDWPATVQTFRDSLHKRLDLMPLIELFAEVKQRDGVMDFADQMVLATKLAALQPVAQVERSRYDVVLLDEYQDTGHAQIEMLAALFSDGRSVTAVGDPLQSIYGWRGANAGNIGRFAQRFRDRAGRPAQHYSLMRSWRNDRRILTAANHVAAELRQSSDTPLIERPTADDGRVVIAYTDTVVQEATWLAQSLRSDWDQRSDWTNGQRTLAILVRKRSGIATLAQAVRDAGLPVEVVDLGGLLTLPEVADVRAVLQVLADHNAGGSLGRLLTGARWQIGPADLVALHERARALATFAGISVSQHARSAAEALGADVANDADDDERIEPSLVEALDDLGDERAYSAVGFRRLTECAQLLRSLRRRVDLPLPDLIGEIERAIGIDVELASRSVGVRTVAGDVGRANLDRFIDEAARFSSEQHEQSGAALSAFMAYLRAAEQEEYGLKPAVVDVQSDRVQVLTVHGAKGLEWDVVAVAGLVEKGFPDQAKGHDWASTPALLPSPLRGDRYELPSVDFDGCDHRGDAEERLKAHRTVLSARHLLEERRLAYVAFTRARKALYASGAAWGSGSLARHPSVFLAELRELAGSGTIEVAAWHQVAEGDTNPLETNVVGVNWPADPLGSRRGAVEAGAALVRAALAEPFAAELPTETALTWERDVDLLLAERAAAADGAQLDVAMPDHLSVSDVVALKDDEAGLARRLRRPVPQRPAKQARRGTAFHTWLEQRWSAETLLDVDELPGAVDDVIDDAELEHLKSAFERSAWADKTPIEVEVPFEMSFGGRVVRGRMDAVFRSSDGRFTVVDWKTGRPPVGADADAKAVQLALYRLAWAALQGISDRELHTIDAAFYYVGADVTVSPANLLSADELRQLISGS